MKGERYLLSLDPYEENVVIAALNDRRNQQLAEHQNTDALDELLLKIIRTPAKKGRSRHETR